MIVRINASGWSTLIKLAAQSLLREKNPYRKHPSKQEPFHNAFK